MPNYGDRANVFEGIQLGAENSFGSSVASIRRILGVYADPTPNVPITIHRGNGSLGATSAVAGKEHTVAPITGIAGYRDITWFLNGVLHDTTPVIPGGATNTRRWVWKPLNYQPNTIRTYTFEHGQAGGTFAERFVYGLINSLGIRSTQGDVGISGQILGWPLQEAASITTSRSAAANPSVAPTLSAGGVAASNPTISLRQSANGVVSAGSSFTVVLGSDPTAGDCLVLAVANDVSTTTVTPSGGGVTWVTAQSANSGTGEKLWVFYGLNATGAAGTKTITVTLSVAGNAAASLYDYANVATASAIEGSTPAGQTGTTGNATTPAITPAAVGDVVFSAVGGYNANPGLTITPATASSWVAGTQATQNIGCGAIAVNTAYLLNAPASSDQETWTNTASTTWSGISIGLKPQPGGVAGTTQLAAGTYGVAYTLADQSGETAPSPGATITILAGQTIIANGLTGLPSGANVKWYISPSVGVTTVSSLQYSGQTNSASTVTTFTTLPSGAPTPPVSSTTGPLTVASVKDTPVNPRSISVYTASGTWNAGTGLPTNGWTQLGRCFDSDWAINNRYTINFWQNANDQSFSDFVERAPDVMMNTTVEHDSFSQATMANLRATNAQFIRWVASSNLDNSGIVIEPGFPFRLEVIMPTFLLNPRAAAPQDTYGRQYEWRMREDDTFGSWIQVTLDNDVAVL